MSRARRGSLLHSRARNVAPDGKRNVCHGGDMTRADDRLLSALRKIRAFEVEERNLGLRLLEVVVWATASTYTTLQRPLGGSAHICVGRGDGEGDIARLEQRFPTRSGVAVLMVERPAITPFDH